MHRFYPAPIIAVLLALAHTLPAAEHSESKNPLSHAATEVRVLANVPYKHGDSLTPYEKERCILDVYLPKDGKAFNSLVWFHGGGLTKGDKDGRQDPKDTVKTSAIARSLAAAGIAVITPNYRFSPTVTFPAYIDDAAAAVAWTRSHIAEYGGDPSRVFVGGHSAGGYLALMLGMDARYLQAQA